MADRRRRAVEHDLPAAFAGARAHVDQPVGGEHDRGVVLDDHQRVARVAQPVHRQHDAVHVARVQADRRLVEHEHGVDERGAKRRRQVDALNLAARERAALPVERQVADADVTEVTQPGADLVLQQLQGVVEQRARQLQAVEEAVQALDRDQHQVVHRQPRQGLELLARPAGADRQEALPWRQRGVGAFLFAEPPEQRFGLQPRAAAGRARGVAAVLRQQHPDVHLVGLALQVAEEALDAVPLLVPVALPVGIAVDHPFALGLRQAGPRRVARDAGFAAVLQQVVLAFLPRRRLHRLDGAGAQGLPAIGDDEAVVDADDPAEAAAGLAGAVGRVEGEERRLRVGVAQVALGAVKPGREAPDHGLRALVDRDVHVDPPTAATQRRLDRLDRPHLLGALDPEPVGDDVEPLARPGRRVDLALAVNPRETARRQPLLDLRGRRARRQFDRERDDEPGVVGGRPRDQVGVDRLGRVVAHRLRRLPVEELRGAGEQQLQVVVQLGHGADRAARRPHRIRLVDRDRRRHAVDRGDRRAVHPVEELARIGAEGLDVAPLPLGVERVEHQARLAGAARAGHDGHLAGADVEVEVLEVVLTRAADADDTGTHGGAAFLSERGILGAWPAGGAAPRRA